MYNERKIAFIICSNNELYYNECVKYINELIVPEECETDIICVTDAEDITEAYNAAMKSSDAKYKVYLHHDLFIYHRNFIQDIIAVFQSDDSLGMLGMIGGVNLPQDAVTWDAWNKGATYACNNRFAFPLVYVQDKENKWSEVEAVDGMIMVTQYDINWREDLHLGWDFYDVSQSLEFRRHGYKIGVPYQEEPWCMHDCGHSKLVSYDTARGKILKEYKEYFNGKFEPVYNGEMFYLQEKLFQHLKLLLEQKDFIQASQIKAMIEERTIESNQLRYAYNIVEIYEKENSENQTGFFENVFSWEEMKEKYDEVKFLVRRAHKSKESKETKILMDMIQNGVLSMNAVLSIMEHSI